MEAAKQTAPLTKETKLLILQGLQRGYYLEHEAEALLDYLNGGKVQGFKMEIVTAKEEIERLETLAEIISRGEADLKEKELASTLRAMGYSVTKLSYEERGETAKRSRKA